MSQEKKKKKKKEKKKKFEGTDDPPAFPPNSGIPEGKTEILIDKLSKVIANASKIVFFTGAGMSAESGISTFRGAKGIWSGLTGLVALGWFGTPIGWKTTSRLAWKLYRKFFFYDIGISKPNAGHWAIGELCKMKKGGVKVITQNVDGLHQLGGVPDEQCFEVHGTVRKFKCIKNGHSVDLGKITKDIPESSPQCKICKSYTRPDFVLFTEGLPGDQWRASVSSIYELGKNDVMIVIGTSAKVYPAASIPQKANARGVTIIEINLEETEFSKMTQTVFLKGKVGEMMKKLICRAKHYMKIKEPSLLIQGKKKKEVEKKKEKKVEDVIKGEEKKMEIKGSVKEGEQEDESMNVEVNVDVGKGKSFKEEVVGDEE